MEKEKRIYHFIKTLKKDPSSWILILSNILTIIFAIAKQWDVFQIIFIYWIQSLIIGVFTIFKIILVKKFSTKSLKIKPKRGIKYLFALFFLFHYGIFHLVYFIFLITERTLTFSKELILIPTGIFIINHLFSLIINFKKDSKNLKEIGKIMFFPYIRIVPMHLIILFGIFFMKNYLVIIFFLLLKTIADLIMHLIEHDLKELSTNNF